MSFRWILREITDPARVTALQEELNDLPEPLARALMLRGIDTFDKAYHFFRPSLDHLHDPFLMQDMEKAAERVAQAIRQRERVLVYGDYDVDGTTATALVTSFLRARGVEASFFIPDRFEHGYGLSRAGIDEAAEAGAGLIIALDCGITAHRQAAYARKRGIDLIICDHHTAGEEIPDALAVLDPKRPDCAYPFKELSGCGVGFKLIQAVMSILDEEPEAALEYLDLLAVSTASDIVPIYGENRVLMCEGLKRLSKNSRLGIRMLAEQASLELQGITCGRIVFTIGPRINAAGRLGDAEQAVRLLLSEDEEEALDLAQRLEALNLQRRTIDRETEREAMARAERRLSGRLRHSLVLYDEDWHQGVIGIVASRIVERFYRPTILLTSSEDGNLKGSGRSIAGVNIYQALKSCEDLLTRFGGHDHAAGLSLEVEHLPAFQERFEEAVTSVTTPEMLVPALEIDALLHLDEIDGRFWRVLEQFEPHGPANMRPLFMARDLELACPPRTVGSDDRHLKLKVRQREGRNRLILDVIGFGLGEQIELARKSYMERAPLELAFSIDENTWNGRTTLQLKAKALRLQGELNAGKQLKDGSTYAYRE